MEYLGPLVIGIASSLIATVAFVSIAELIRRVVLPWYADRVYRGVRLDGKWRASRFGTIEIDSSSTSRNEFDLKQKGDKVTGISILQGEDEPDPTIYRVQGQVRDGYFSATAWPVAPDMVDAMACLFRVFHEGNKLRFKGRLTYLSNRTAEIKSTDEDIEFCKESS